MRSAKSSSKQGLPPVIPLLVKGARAKAIASKTRETRSQALTGSSIQVDKALLVTLTRATRVRKKVWYDRSQR
jgi:hypothetical protein